MEELGGFSVAEQQAMIACMWVLSAKRKEATRENIADYAKKNFDAESVPLEPAFESLASRGLLVQAGPDGAYGFGEGALELARDFDYRYESAGFDEWLGASASSAAYVEYCRRVYGTPFVQFNMTDAEQIEALLDRLHLAVGERVLDLGCALGTQAEHISDRTGAHVTGLDFASGAIKLAAGRTAAKSDRLSFVVGNLNDLRLPPASFDAVIFFDTIYFVADLAKTLADSYRLLAPGGRLAIFYSQTRHPEDPEELLSPRGTKMAKALVEQGIEFEAIDFSANEKAVWEKELAVATDMRQAFEAEGNQKIWESRDKEARRMLEFVRAGNTARYLYLIDR